MNSTALRAATPTDPEIGRDPLGQALAVPAKPASGLGASRCDPSRFERITEFYPASDDFDPETRTGSRSSMRIKFTLKGPNGATQFMIGTCWGPRQSDASTHRLISGGTFDPCRPSGWDVGYHSPVPQFDGQEDMECDLLPGGRCFYDGSGCRADDWIDGFVTGGSDWVWSKLEAEYRSLFGGEVR